LADREVYKKGEIWIELPSGTVETIKRFINYYENKEKLIAEKIPVNSSILLYGPPGTGKTKTASYIASMLGLPLITARTDALISSYLGATSKNIRMLMDYAQSTPCVLFLDEFDALAKIRDDSNEIGELKRVVVTLLQNIDSLENVVLIAATNHEKLLDKAVWRRFHYKIEISLPNEEIRKNLTEKLIKENIDKKTIEIFVELTNGMSGADIESICYEYLKEKAIENNIHISKLLMLALMENIPELKVTTMTKKEIILFIKSKYNLSYERIAIILNISKTYVSKVIKDSKDAK
jgi:SpoVK/Ycf46/Vps4 family AAA+-type ATPase